MKVPEIINAVNILIFINKAVTKTTDCEQLLLPEQGFTAYITE